MKAEEGVVVVLLLLAEACAVVVLRWGELKCGVWWSSRIL